MRCFALVLVVSPVIIFGSISFHRRADCHELDDELLWRVCNVVAIEQVGLTMKRLLRFLREENGPTAVEYAVMLALIVVVCLAGVQALTTETANSYNGSSDAIDNALKSR
jgi:pilus assembly protein Flp/PilA